MSRDDILRLISNLNRELEKFSVVDILDEKIEILKKENEKLRLAAEPKDCGHEPHIEALRGRIKELEAHAQGLEQKLMQIRQEFDA